MYSYNWDIETGGLLLSTSAQQFSKEPRPVYSKELDLLGFNRYWKYDANDSAPLMWAEANNYIYRGKLVAQTKGGSFFTAPKIVILDEPEPQGGKLLPVDIEAMVSKNWPIMEPLINETIKKATNVYEKFKDKVDLFHVSFSGGKDSEVTLDIIQRALPHNVFVVVFGDTGMEFPDTYEAIKLSKKRCEESGIRFIVAKSHLHPTESWNKIGPPTSTVRWCCSIHKTTPQLLTLRKLLGKNSFTEMAFVGVRADESVRRSGYDYVSYGTKHKGQYSCNPILTWSSAEVYLYIYTNHLHLNEAYKRGNTRAGCLVCPMSTNRNDYLNYLCYRESTKPLLDIIHDLNSSDSGNEDRMKSYIENNGWKARKNGRDLKISPRDYDESIIGGNLVITFKDKYSSWRQWIKTLGNIINTGNEGLIEIESGGKVFKIYMKEGGDGYLTVTTPNLSSPSDVQFLKNLRKVFRKCHYCVGCRVCEANCKFGNLKFNNCGIVSITDSCKKCGQCLDIDTGCYVYKSLWLSKGLGKMNNKSLDCYAAHAPKIEWFQQYVKLGDKFKSENSLGSNQIPAFNRFLRDAGVINGETETILGSMLREYPEEEFVWGLMLTNLAYTPEVGWYINSFGFDGYFGQNLITSKLESTDGVSSSALKSIPAALKRISALPFSRIGFGISEKAPKEDGGARFIRMPWLNPNEKVILYSLYKFSEACGDYKQFTLSRLMDTDIESDGVTPVQLFGLDKDTLTTLLKGLSANYPDYINVTFTLNLDNITLRDDKTSKDVLTLF